MVAINNSQIETKLRYSESSIYELWLRRAPALEANIYYSKSGLKEVCVITNFGRSRIADLAATESASYHKRA